MICPNAGAATVPPKIDPFCGSSTTTSVSNVRSLAAGRLREGGRCRAQVDPPGVEAVDARALPVLLGAGVRRGRKRVGVGGVSFAVFGLAAERRVAPETQRRLAAPGRGPYAPRLQ